VIKNNEFDLKTMDRMTVLFEAGVGSKMTSKKYRYEIEQFCRFSKITFQQIRDIPKPDMQILTEDFVLYRRPRVSHGTIRAFINSLKYYYDIFELDGLNWRKLKKLLPEKKKHSGSQAYTDDDIKQLLSCTHTKRVVVFIHLMACSGIRVGAITDIQLKHFGDMPNGCKSLLVYPMSKEEYTTFITSECFEKIEDYLDERRKKGEKITDESYLFVNRSGRKITDESLNSQMSRFIRTNLKRERESETRYSKMGNHAFRKRFNTTLKLNSNCNVSLSELLLGHTYVKLDSHYFKPTIEQLFSEYEKNLNELYIDEKYKLTTQLDEKSKTLDELQNKDVEIEKLKYQMSQLMAHFENLGKIS